MGRPGARGHVQPEPRRRRGVPRLVGAVPPKRERAGRSGRADGALQGDRRPPRAAGDRGTHASCCRRRTTNCYRRRFGKHLAEQHPGRPLLRAAGPRPSLLHRGPGRAARRGRGLPHRRARVARAGAAARDRPVHRHRRLDRPAAAVGDRRWRDLADAHDEIVRKALARHRGHEIKTMGDGFLASFDGPARAIRCAQEVGARGRADRDPGARRRPHRASATSSATTSPDSP